MEEDRLLARRSIDGFRSSILRIFLTWVLGLLSFNIDGGGGRSVQSLLSITLSKNSPNSYSSLFVRMTVATFQLSR